MFKKLLELRQQKAAKVAEMRALLDSAEKEGKELTEEEKGKFDTLKALVKEMSEEIERYEAVADEERSQTGKPAETRSKQYNNDELRHYVKTGELRSTLSTTVGENGG